MFNKNKAINANTKDNTTLISPDTVIQGNIRFFGTVHLEGSVHGNIGSKDGRLTVAENGSVEGDIHVGRIVIHGNVRGNVYASEHLELTAGAVIEGNVFYQVVEMAKGAQVNGSLKHYANGMPEIQSLPLQVEVCAEVVD